MAKQNILTTSYESVQPIGHGSFGVVASVICKESKICRAVKLVDSTDKELVREINLLLKPGYHHDSVIRCYGQWQVETGSLGPDWDKVLEQKYRRFPVPSVMTALEFDLCVGKFFRLKYPICR